MDAFYNDENDHIRIGNIEIFLEIAIDEYIQAEKYDLEIKESYPKDQTGTKHLDRLFFIANEKYKHEIKGIIMLHSFLEAVINELAQVKLGSSFFKEDIEKLKLTTKWKIVPRLIYRNGLVYSKVYFDNLKKLVTLRNKLTHYKTKVLNDGIEPYKTEYYLEVLKRNLYTINDLLADLKALNTEYSYDYREFDGQLKRIEEFKKAEA